MKKSDTNIVFSPAQEREWIKETNIIYGGLIGMGLIMIQPFLAGGESMSMAATVSVMSFALSIPILAALLMLNHQENFVKQFSPSRVVAICKAIGQIAAVTGFVAGLWHINPIVGQVAIGSILIATSAHSAGYVKLYRLQGGADKKV